MNYILCESATKQKYNAAKARTDARIIAVQAGYREIVLFHNGYPKLGILCEIIYGCFKAMCLARKDDTILIQYPYYPSIVNKLFLHMLLWGKKIKKYAVVMLIHDVIALRQRISQPDDKLLRLGAEVQSWAWVDQVICHNESMLEILKKAHPFNHYRVLGMFDYLYDGPICERHYQAEPIVMVAGNLSSKKCGYIYELDCVEGVRFDLFGSNYEGKETEHVKYRGKYSPEDLIRNLDGQFGLVWDGDSVNTCSGDYGEYLKYNNPFKFSMYLAAGVPIITWTESALADFVMKKNIGITIDSLKNLESSLRQVDRKQYSDMCHNVLLVREQIIHGQHLYNCI